jgi:hypothetical protein
VNGPIKVDFKEPIQREAWLVTAENIQQVADWCGGVVQGAHVHFTGHRDVGYGAIGEYVIKGEANFFSMDDHWFNVHYVARENAA